MTQLKVAEKKPHLYDVNDFLKIFGLVLEVYNKRLSAADVKEKRILYTASFPDNIINPTGTGEATMENVPHNIVVYSIPRRENGTLSEHAFGTPREVRPRQREEITVTDANGHSQARTIYGKWYDNTVRFECYSPSLEQANDLIMRVEGIYEVHAPWLESIGFIKTIYSGRTTPTYPIRMGYHAQAFSVYLKTERQWYRDDTIITSIEAQVNEEITSYHRDWQSNPSQAG